MMLAGKNLLESDSLRIDFCRADAGSRARGVVVTFTERCNRDLTGPGFGTEFLLAQGRDVIAVKNARDDWYAPFAWREIDAIRAVAARYPSVSTYGSSMGAYAAVRFAADLDADVAVAISPIFDVRQPWDTRFAVDLPVMTALGYDSDEAMLAPGHISAHTAYRLAYDPYCREDARHVETLAGMTSGYTALKVPFGGHPVGPALRDAGLLARFVLDALDGRDDEPLPLGRMERTPWVRHARVRNLLERGKLRMALIASSHALAQSPDWCEAQLVHAQILDRLARTDEAIPHALRAIELAPQNPYFVAIICEFLGQRGYYELATELAELGMERMGPLDVLTRARSLVAVR